MTTTFVPLHAAGDGAWSWHLVAAELRARGHDTVAIDLPSDASAGLWDYADAIVRAVGERDRVVLVAHSFGGFTAPLVCARRPVDAIVFVTAMIPTPGEAPADWWANTGHAEARRRLGGEGDDRWTYYHDVPAALAAEAMTRSRTHPSERAYREPWPLAAWPAVATHFLLCRDDRLFPAPWMRALVRERLGIAVDEIASGHCPNLSQPAALADRLVAYARPRAPDGA
ncbi:MAG TPA: alpha/beta hydrolase [Kofleriaceae bacterium]|nr:alpha/beta hydrolase [Kofleriaceae bacterium]